MINLVEWKDRIIQFPKRFYIKNNSDGTVTLEEAPGEVAEPGTPVSASNLNTLRSAVLQASPVSEVKFFARKTTPEGWLFCDGSAVSRSTYRELFDAIGTTFGEGDGNTTFNLPDLRGQFIRGWSDGVGVDADREFGSPQEGTKMAKYAPYGYYDVKDYDVLTNVGNGSTGRTAGGSEVRPYTIGVRPPNVALLPCIKY